MSNHTFHKTLCEPKRIVVLTLDEAIPAAIIFVMAWVEGSMFVAMVSSVISVFLVRFVKKGRKIGWVISLIYWFFPHSVTKYIFRNLPDSSHRRFVR